MACLIPKVGLAVALEDVVRETEEMELEALEATMDVLLTEL